MKEAFVLMQWPLIACLLLPGILVYLGLHVVRREIIFVDLALAQVSALGTAVCLAQGHDIHDIHTYLYSISFTLIGALVFTLTRTNEKHRVPQEALIGVVYVVAAAAGLLMLSRSPEGNDELKRTLIGDVLLVQKSDVLRTFALYAVIALVHIAFRRQFFMISFEPARAQAEGISVKLWDFIFYALFGLVVTSFLHIGGVLLVFSYLIVPAVCANLLAESIGAMLMVGWALATVAGVAGVFASYKLDFPTGAAIVCTLGLTLLLTGVVAGVRKLRSPKGGATEP